jgi:adenylyl-sulfate kinase
MPDRVLRVRVCGSLDLGGAALISRLLPETASHRNVVSEADDPRRYAISLVSGAPAEDAVVLLVDGRTGIEPQTRRFAAIASFAGVPRAILAVIGTDKAAFDSIAAAFSTLLPKLAFKSVTPVPVCQGDQGTRLAWYKGPWLSEVLDSANSAAAMDAGIPGIAVAADGLDARVVWMHETPLFRGRAYLLMLGTRSVTATVIDITARLDPESLDEVSVRELGQNDIGRVSLSLTHPLDCQPYLADPVSGGFVLLDRLSRDAVGAGFVTEIRARNPDIVWHALDVDKAARSLLKGQKPAVLWFTGLSGAGKSTIANLVEKRLHALGHHTMILDGDNVRHGLNRDLGFSEADRVENIRRIAEVSRLFVEAGLIVLVSFISPYRTERLLARDRVGEGEFLEIFVDTPIGECRRRDPKGLYEKADSGLIRNFTGVDAPYEEPLEPEIRLRTLEGSAEALADKVVTVLRERGNIA